MSRASEPVAIPGGRDARGTLDRAVERERTDAVVVACPPHPQHRGHRGDSRLTGVSDALAERGLDCLRFDYGPWDQGRGERTDALNALAWARERYARVGIFGYSFGGGIALLAAAEGDVGAASALAPVSRVEAGTDIDAGPDIDAGSDVDARFDVAAALDEIACPVQIVYGTRDDTADWEPVVERARECGATVVETSADHFFVGQQSTVGATVADFLAAELGR